MNKSLKIFLGVVVVFAVIAAILIVSGNSSFLNANAAANLAECKDKVDNDGDGKIDYPADAGCRSKNDRDESDCGDSVCEGGDTCSKCEKDCGKCIVCGDGICNGQETCNTCKSDCGACYYCGDGMCNGDETCSTCEGDCGKCNSCSENDNGKNYLTKGTVSGYKDTKAYSLTDFCANSSLTEYYCSGSTWASESHNCNSGNTTACSDGACVKSVADCNDGLDNDLDGKIDLNDAGCSSSTDNDESNCGDASCEGSETCSSCSVDCGNCDSCSETDGGIDSLSKGTISGYLNSKQYSYTDYCLNASLVEYYCSGKSGMMTTINCIASNYTGCSNSVCY